MESALLYAKSWSKYTKELLSWVEKRLNTGRRSKNYKNVMFILRTPGMKLLCLACFDDLGAYFGESDKHYSDVVVQCLELSCAVPLADIECAKSYAKMAESAKALASQQVSERRTPSDFVQEKTVRAGAKSSRVFSISGVHALPRDLRGRVQERHRVQPAGAADGGHPPEQQVHAGARSHERRWSEGIGE